MPEQKLYGTVLIRAKSILDFIAQCRQAPTLKEISEGVSITKPTVLKILTTLDVLGFVSRNESDKTYHLGMELFRYGQLVAEDFDLRRIAQGALSTLRDETNETINLGVISNNRVTLIQKYESPQSVNLKSHIGGSMNLYSSSMGKAILATFSEDQLDAYISAVAPLKGIGPNTITDTVKLRADLKETQKQGFSIDNEENEPDAYCVGFSLNKNGHLYGAFSITTPKYRMSPERQQEFVKLAKAAQQNILAVL